MNLDKLDSLPSNPGVYKFLKKDGEILYIGKAINLRNRVRSYFSDKHTDRPRIKKMIPLIEDVETIETNNEIESLVLESSLIKRHQPYFNSDKKDDKSYSWIYISTKEKFPTVKIVKKVSNEELRLGKLYGPYPSSLATRRIFTYLRKLYPFCTCKESQRSSGCLYFHLGLCPGPYQGHISEKEYRKNIKQIEKFLSGRKRGQIRILEKEMKEYSLKQEYEKARELRDKIKDLNYLGERIDFEYEDSDTSYIERRKKVLKQSFKELEIEINILDLKRIECYDISNIQGKLAYGSMVVAEDGGIVKSEYRIFKIRREEKPDDPGMLSEVLQRRFSSKNSHKYTKDPELVLIDGGKSQLSVVSKFVPEYIKLVGISKGKRLKRSGSKQLDEFWIREGGMISEIKIRNKEILIDLRDEAHRFAILHHRKARRKELETMKLSNIPGVGIKSSKKLLAQFGKLENIKRLNYKDIDSVLGNKRISKQIYEALNS